MFVAFEGPIAAGKTTLAGLYSAHLKCPLLLEEFSGNEFLADFYENRERWSLPMQVWFLLDRHEQLAATSLPTESALIADYAFIKNEIFAELLLDGREFRLFQRTARALSTKHASPDLIVHLDAKNDVLLERIANRGRAFEKHIDRAYLNSLRAAYDTKLRDAFGSAIFHFDTSELDLQSSEQLIAIFTAINSAVTKLSGVLQNKS
jgi:deoxyguanosine kinase